MNEITIPYLFELLLRRIYIVILAAVVAAGAVFSYCNWLVTPVYSANAQIIISNGAVIVDTQSELLPTEEITKISSADIQASLYIADVCVDYLKTGGMYKRLSEALNGKYTEGQLRGAVSVSLREEDSMFVNISARNTDPNEAVKIANAFAAIAPDYLKDSIPYAQVIPSDAAIGAGKVSPATTRTTMLGFIVGAILSYVIVLLIDVSDRTIKDEMNFTSAYNIPVLGCIPNFDAAAGKDGYYGK